MKPFLITDCGSTTTKALLIGGDRPQEAHLVASGEAPTTVEAPYADVTVGVLAAIAALEEACGLHLRVPAGTRPDAAAADYLSTSSAGGGLQMLVAGVVGRFSAASAERAALAAGAIVQRTFSVEDGLDAHERIAELRRLRPDMALLAGGTDGGGVTHVAEMAELLRAAAPEQRFGGGMRLPVVFAGNTAARPAVVSVLGDRCDLRLVDNVRPDLERERLNPARDAIHELFMDHVMARAPGYDRLSAWVAAPVLPTPAAVGVTVRAVAERLGRDVLAVDIGGATTDVFSVTSGRYHRSVGANFGMSYSATQVLREAGAGALARWLPLRMGDREISDRIANKMVRPTTVPATPVDLLLEQALAREALRLALAHHRRTLPPTAPQAGRRRLGDSLAGRRAGAECPVGGLSVFGLILGSGGVLSHAPRRAQAAMMLLDAFEPVGVVRLGVDSVFMLPHLGVLRGRCAEAADAAFWRDCLVPLGTAVAPAGSASALSILLHLAGGTQRLTVPRGGLVRVPLVAGEVVRADLAPGRGGDLGAGPGRPVRSELHGGMVGLLFDCRGRPLPAPERPAQMAAWLAAAGAWP